MKAWTTNLYLSTTWITTAGATGDDVDHRTLPLTLLRLLPVPCVNLQPHFQGGNHSSSREVCTSTAVPPLTSPPAFRVAGLVPLLSCPCYSTVSSTQYFGNQVISTIPGEGFDPHHQWQVWSLTKRHSCGCFLLNQWPPSSKSPLNARYYHTHFAWIFAEILLLTFLELQVGRTSANFPCEGGVLSKGLSFLLEHSTFRPDFVHRWVNASLCSYTIRSRLYAKSSPNFI